MKTPTLYLSDQHPATCAEDFIGEGSGAGGIGARLAARRIEVMAQHLRAEGYPPVRLAFAGPSGTGKTALTRWFCRLFGVGKFAVYEANGTDVTIDYIRELNHTLGLRANELFGEYRVIAWHEADRITDTAKVGALTLLDNLPVRTALIVTTNADIRKFEERFQRRFKYTQIARPSDQEILDLLARWEIPLPVRQMIVMGCSGNVAMALTEAEEWLQSQPLPQPAGPARAHRPQQQVLVPA